jgi:hypothetical protein
VVDAAEGSSTVNTVGVTTIDATTTVVITTIEVTLEVIITTVDLSTNVFSTTSVYDGVENGITRCSSTVRLPRTTVKERPSETSAIGGATSSCSR